MVEHHSCHIIFDKVNHKAILDSRGEEIDYLSMGGTACAYEDGRSCGWPTWETILYTYCEQRVSWSNKFGKSYLPMDIFAHKTHNEKGFLTARLLRAVKISIEVPRMM